MFIQKYHKLEKTKTHTKEKELKAMYDENTDTFEYKDHDYQADIDLFKGQSLKEMIEKNLMPETNKQSFYGDTTIYNNADIHDINQAVRLSELLPTEEQLADYNATLAELEGRQEINHETGEITIKQPEQKEQKQEKENNNNV